MLLLAVAVLLIVSALVSCGIAFLCAMTVDTKVECALVGTLSALQLIAGVWLGAVAL